MERRIMAAAMMTAVALGTFAAGPAGARPGWDREAECRYARADGRPGWSTEDVRREIACAVAKWPVDGGLDRALAVAACESGPDLMHPREPSGYSGTYQQSERYWPGRRDAFDPGAWDLPIPESSGNPRANVVVSIRMAHATGWYANWRWSADCWG